MLLKPTGSHSLQLCRLFGHCTAVLLSSEFQPPSMESSHTCPGQTLAEWKGEEENRLSGTCLPNTQASPPRSAPSPRLPRPQHLAATSPTHTTIVARSQAPTKLHAAGPLPDTVSTQQLCPCQGSLSPPALGSLQLQGLLMGLGPRDGSGIQDTAPSCCSTGKGQLEYRGAGDAGGTIPICNRPPIHRSPTCVIMQIQVPAHPVGPSATTTSQFPSLYCL